MNSRTSQILLSVIREFIESGEPVSSRKLTKIGDFGVREATLRNELNSLMDEGFLTQPHTSGGRIPTDKGYVFLVERIIDDFFEEEPEEHYLSPTLKQEFEKGDLTEFMDDFSDELQVLSVGFAPVSSRVWKSGLDDLFSKLIQGHWVNDPEDVFEIIQDFEQIDERVENLFRLVEARGAPKVFVGRSPITKSKELSVIADSFENRDGKFVLAAVGPKQMDYERNIRFFRELKELIS